MFLQKMIYYGVTVAVVFIFLFQLIDTDLDIKGLLLIVLFCFVLALGTIITTGSFDTAYLIHFFRALISWCTMFTVYYFYEYLKSFKDVSISFELIYIRSTVVYISGTAVFLLFPTLRNFWYSIIVDFSENTFIDFSLFPTRFGFAGFSGFLSTFIVSSAAIYLSYLYINGEISLRSFKIYSIVLLVGNFFYGRSGLVITVLCLGATAVYCFIFQSKKLLLFYFNLIILCVIAVLLGYFFIPASRVVIQWAFEPIINLATKGELSSYSTDDLLSFYKNFSPSVKTFIKGDGYWTDGGGYYGSTDVGFMRHIYYGGVFYTISLYCMYVFFLFILFRKLKKNNKTGSLFIIFLLLLNYVIFEFKGDVTFLSIKSFLPLLLSNMKWTEKIYYKENSLLF